MQFNYGIQSVLAKKVVIFVLSTAVLFCGFFLNSWNVLMVSEEQWANQRRNKMESWVVGRMVKSHQDGIFSSGGLLGLGIPDEEPVDWLTDYGKFQERQYFAYINDLKFYSYLTYNSQIGGQGIFFSLLDNLLPIAPQKKLQLFSVFQSLLSSFAIAFIILWFYREFGMCAALFVIAAAVFSHWLVFFGRDLFWSLWVFYIPIIFVMYFLRNNRTDARYDEIKCGALVFSAVFVKCLINGYEFITTTLVMMMVPFVYYYVLGTINTKKFLRYIFIAVFCSTLAIFLSVTILSFQIASVKGNFLDGIHYIIDTFQRRSHANPHDFPAYAQSLMVSTTDVVISYLKAKYCDLNNYFSTSIPFVSQKILLIRYWYLIFLFLISSVVLYSRSNRYTSITERKRSLALISATWVSILAPLSWFIIFKSHSFVHLELFNNMIWQMPFTFFGFAVLGLAVSSIFRDILHLTKRSP